MLTRNERKPTADARPDPKAAIERFTRQCLVVTRRDPIAGFALFFGGLVIGAMVALEVARAEQFKRQQEGR